MLGARVFANNQKWNTLSSVVRVWVLDSLWDCGSSRHGVVRGPISHNLPDTKLMPSDYLARCAQRASASKYLSTISMQSFVAMVIGYNHRAGKRSNAPLSSIINNLLLLLLFVLLCQTFLFIASKEIQKCELMDRTRMFQRRCTLSPLI